MNHIHQGTQQQSSQTTLHNNLKTRPNKSMFVVPSSMRMQKITTNISYRLDDDDALLLTIPYVINDMTMLKGMKMKMGISYSSAVMQTVRGLGDVSVIYLRDIWKDSDIRTRQRLSAGIGIKAPTGTSQARAASSGRLLAINMQAGTGSWDGILLINGTLAFGNHADGGALWFVAPSLTYQHATYNSLGYKVGDHLNYDVSTRYRLSSTFNLKLDVNGIIAQQDQSNGTKDSNTGLIAYQNPMMSMLDNTQNTGGHSVFLTPGFQWVAAPSISISGEYRVPLYQRMNGTQIVTQQWWFLRARMAF